MRGIRLPVPVTKISDITMTRINQGVRSTLSSLANTAATTIKKSLHQNTAHPLDSQKSSPPGIHPLRASLSKILNSIKDHTTVITNKSQDPEQKEIKQFTKALNSSRSKSDRVAATLLNQEGFKLPSSLGKKSIIEQPSGSMARDIAISAAYTQKPKTLKAAMDKYQPLDKKISSRMANAITGNFENLVRGSDKKAIRRDGEILKILVENQNSGVNPNQITEPLEKLLARQIHFGNPFMADVSKDLTTVMSEIKSAQAPEPLKKSESLSAQPQETQKSPPRSLLDVECLHS
jgi:hypothetical protein